MTKEIPFLWMKSGNNHLTNLCLSFLTNEILKSFDKVLTGIILVDLQNKFDVICLEILLQKRKGIILSESIIISF